MKDATSTQTSHSDLLTLFLCGDVMTGRGIDQILPHPSDPRIYETYVKDAGVYVRIAEQANGPIPNPVDFDYIWGDALEELDFMTPDFRIINLETSITASDDAWRGKGINYRMNPGNSACLNAAAIDCCVLANNHVLDWGYAGLEETLKVLHAARITTSGAGQSLVQAQAPAILTTGDLDAKGRVLVYSLGATSSGIPRGWAASADNPGVNLLADYSDASVAQIADHILRIRQDKDLVVVSIHWGGNWGYEVNEAQRRFAHGLIDSTGVDLVHGHSSHHAKGIEVYRGKPIIYGCGDFINDYEGIEGHAAYRGDLSLMYFPSFDPKTRELMKLMITPLQIQRFRLQHAVESDLAWLTAMFNREGAALGTRAAADENGRIEIRWDKNKRQEAHG